MLKRSLVLMPRIQYGVKQNSSDIVAAWKLRIKLAVAELRKAKGPISKAAITVKLRHFLSQLRLARKENRHALP